MEHESTGLFAPIPEDLSALSDDELRTLEASHVESARRIAANDADFVGDTPAASVIEQMQEGVVALERVRAEITSRVEAEENYASEVNDLAAQFGVSGEAADEDEEAAEAAEEDEDDDEALAAEEPEALAAEDSAAEEAASEEPVTASGPRRLRVPASHTPRPTDSRAGAPLVASAGLEPVVRPGTRLDGAGLARALGEAHRRTTARKGVREKVVVASAAADYPIERQLGENPRENAQRIRALTSPAAITASGGFCAPYPSLYDLPIVASAERPVRDALASFQATRGGITYPTPLGLGDVSGAITVVTAAEDEAGGSDGTKNVLVIDCDEFQEAEVKAISAIVEHGNLNARAWPERVENVAELVQAYHARIAEGELLAALTDGSTSTTDAAVYGAYSTLIQGILKAGAAMRSRHRMRPEERLRLLLPMWSRELIAADLAHEAYNRFSPGAATTQVESHLQRLGVNVSWYMDEDGTTTQIYDAQAAGALDGFLTNVVWYLFPEGTWLFLDMGRLDLGIVRDADLNSTNDFQMFWETFEGAAKVGVESVRVVSTVCPSGESAAGSDNIITC